MTVVELMPRPMDKVIVVDWVTLRRTAGVLEARIRVELVRFCFWST
jgi:hypothetical protein